MNVESSFSTECQLDMYQKNHHIPFTHFFWSASMKFSSILKGLVLTAALFMFVSEAAAQLPVRTRELRLLGATSGIITQNTVAATATYTVTWPATASIVAANHRSFLYAAAGSTASQQDLAWFDVDGDLVDNNGNAAGTADAGQVTYWADDNSITGEAGFLWDATTNTLTMGQAGATAEIIFTNGVNTGTLQTAALTGNHTYSLPNITGAGPFTLNIPVADNLPSAAVNDQILPSNLDGTATWSTNPFAGVERGIADPADGAFTHTQATVGAIDAFGAGYNDLIMVSSIDVNATPTGNILSVTAVAANSFTVSSSGPFGATERIAWLFIPIP